jgi:hypothetical protein
MIIGNIGGYFKTFVGWLKDVWEILSLIAGIAGSVFNFTLKLHLKGPWSILDKIPGLASKAGGAIAHGAVEAGKGIWGLFPGGAAGGIVSQAGTMWVGEQGPELLTLPRGASIQPLPWHPGTDLPIGALGRAGGRPIVVQVMLDKRVLAEAMAEYDSDQYARQ